MKPQREPLSLPTEFFWSRDEDAVWKFVSVEL